MAGPIFTVDKMVKTGTATCKDGQIRKKVSHTQKVLTICLKMSKHCDCI